jgi:hypothetical protein
MGDVTRTRRWLPFAVATLATLLLAGGFGLAVDRLATPQVRPAPTLKTVPAATLNRLGIRLSAPSQPLYCDVAGEVVSRGWLRSGSGGCAISQRSAEAAARQGGANARVVESVLALVTSSRVTTVGRDLLAWVVVTQQSVSSNCVQGVGGYSFCVGSGRSGFNWSQIVIVDAHSGGVVNQQRLNPVGGGRIRPSLPLPGTVPTGG